MYQELVSVIMPTYNTGKKIADSIQSVLSQTYQNLELLITDDASTDEFTKQIINDIAQKDKRLKAHFLDTNRGTGYARNEAIKRAQGRFIAFCDSDDRWTIDKLQIQLNFMQERNCAICCSTYIICDQYNHEIGINIPPRIITYNMLKRDNKIGCLTAIYDTQKLGRKFYMPAIRKRQDWALLLQIMKESQICYAYTLKPLAYYCKRRNSISSNKISLIKYNLAVYHQILGYSLFKSYVYFFLLFLPSYTLKIMKRKYYSFRIYNKVCAHNSTKRSF